MNIDYAQILKNATARQQALEALESELSEVDAIREHLALAELRAQQLLDAYKALDQEGRSLLGPLINLLGYIENEIEKIEDVKGFFANVVDLINKES